MVRFRISMFDWPNEWVPSSDISSSPDRTTILFFQNKLYRGHPIRALEGEIHEGKREVLDAGNQPQTQQFD